jgi:hypothetical protein
MRRRRATRPPDNTECDGRHLLCVSYLTERPLPSAYNLGHSKQQSNWRQAMLVRKFVHLTTDAIFLAMALMLALPFFMALSAPFVGR